MLGECCKRCDVAVGVYAQRYKEDEIEVADGDIGPATASRHRYCREEGDVQLRLFNTTERG